jgi:hypothetical protein
MAGATNKKQKAPSQALRVAQLQSTCVPLKRTRSDALSSVELSKLEAASSNDSSCGWTLASNLRIVRMHEHCNVVVNRRVKACSAVGKRLLSPRHADQNTAEKAAFEFRHSIEGHLGKGKVDNWLDFNQKLLNGDHVVAPTKVLSSDSSTKAVNSSRKQSLEMSGTPA